ncbi:hypothetical protein H6G33_16595 [Calothrix sp. FACHB-1219]|nr:MULTISPECIES: hypothetical protein [unclassified Calothrix]MBD2203052.1 hypothetical protein [Calothrix sp. FACHB-168]MBD2218653.1 hypothetical protein [Calothrix sp. FACHB-1219]
MIIFIYCLPTFLSNIFSWMFLTTSDIGNKFYQSPVGWQINLMVVT